MWHFFSKIQSSFMRTVSRMDTAEWTVFLLVVILIGIFCMRGFGSRKNY